MVERLAPLNTYSSDWKEAPRNKVYCCPAEALLFRLPKRSIDIFWFSPPYNLDDRFRGGNFNISKIKTQYDDAKKYKGDGTGLPEVVYQAQQSLVLALAGQALKTNGVIFYSHKVRLKNGVAINPRVWIDTARLHVIQEVIWNRGGTANGDPRRFRPVYETIYVLANRPAVRVGNVPEFRLNNPGKSSGGQGYYDVWDLNPKTLGQYRSRIGHPASTPYEIVRRCVEVSPNPKGLICDPYCGTGTTGAVALEFGGNFLLSDISYVWAEHAEERMNELRDVRQVGDEESESGAEG